jgi:hypothetical protein
VHFFHPQARRVVFAQLRFRAACCGAFQGRAAVFRSRRAAHSRQSDITSPSKTNSSRRYRTSVRFGHQRAAHKIVRTHHRPGFASCYLNTRDISRASCVVHSDESKAEHILYY